MTNTDDAPVDVVLRTTLECAEGWDPDARLLGNVRAGDMARALREALKLQSTLDFTQNWWAVRAEHIREVAEEHGCWPEVCNILANGTAGLHETPTYAQKLNLALHDAATARKELAGAREVWHQEHRDTQDCILRLELENARLRRTLAKKETPSMKIDPKKYYVYLDVLTHGDSESSGFVEVPEADFRLLWPHPHALEMGNPPSTKKARDALERVMELPTFDTTDADAERIPGDHYLRVAVC